MSKQTGKCRNCGTVVEYVHRPEWGPVAYPGVGCPSAPEEGDGSHEVDTYRESLALMLSALKGIGWTAREEYLAGGLWGIVVTGDDMPDLLVTPDPDDLSDPWIVGLDCQSHPDHGTDEGTLFVPWASWDVLPGQVSRALHVLRTLDACPCGEHPRYPVAGA